MKTCARLLPVALALSFPASLCAQGQFHHLPKVHLPHVSGGIADLLWFDADGDGDRDLLAVGQSTRLLRRTGPMLFASETTAVPGSIRTRAAALGDIDGDGDLDLVIARETDEWVFRNQNGVFTDVTATALPFVSDDSRAMALGDVDGDGDLDLVLGNVGSPDRLLLNSGTGQFTAGALPGGAGTVALALVDIDGDGDLDLFRGSATAATEVLRRQGGAFVPGVGVLPNDGGGTVAIVADDLDGDGDVDLFVGKANGASRLFSNQGGVFVDATAQLPPNLPAPQRAIVCDTDGDGDRDLVLTSLQGLVLLRNDPAGFVDRRQDLPATAGVTYAVTAQDVDGDGDIDLLPQSGRLQLLANFGGRFVDASGMHVDIAQSCSRFADIDGDGDLDLLTAPFSSSAYGCVHRNDGNGVFTDVTATAWQPMGAARTQYAFDVGDVDGDGDVDLVLGQLGQDRLFLGDGAGHFAEVTASHLPVTSDATLAVLLVDIDADGDLDLVAGNSQQANRLYHNDGTGHFTLAANALPNDAYWTQGVAAADVDGDGDRDLLFADWNTTAGSQVRLYVNQGGVFVAAAPGRLPPGADYDGGFAVADLDRDGDVDFVALGVLHQNDGAGNFTDATAARMPRRPGIEPRIADFDGDGDLDLVSYQCMMRNDGTGHFTDANDAFVGSGYFGIVPRPYAVGDVDGDGDVDVLGSYDLFLNRQRQIAVPRLPVLGGTLQVDVHAAAASTASPAFGVVMIASALRPAPMPFWGVLRVDLAAVFATEGLLVDPTTGVASLRGAVPNVPALAGLDVYLQALVLHDQNVANWRFTNAVRETLVP